MAPSVNSDLDVKTQDETDSNAGVTQWLTTLTQSITKGDVEGKERSETASVSNSDDADDISDDDISDDSDLSAEQIRNKYDIDDFSEEGLMDVELGEDSSVGEKAAQDFIDGIRDDVKSGKLSKDSDEAKLVDLMDAQSAIDNGYDLYGYAEYIQWGDVTYRESQTDPTHLTGDDVKEMVDEDKLAEQISGLMQNEGISKRYDDALKGAIESIPAETRSDIAAKVDKAMFEPDSKDPNLDFEDYVIATKEKAAATGDEALSDKIQSEVDNYFEALQALDPESYADRKQTFDQNMMTHQLDAYMADPDSIDPENASISLRDTIDVAQHGVNGALQVMDKGDKSYNAYQKLSADLEKFKGTLDNLSAEDQQKLGKAMMLATNASNQPGVTSAERERLFQNVINDNLKSLPESSKSTFKRVLDSASSTGTLSAMTGAFSLLSGSMQLANGSWDDMTSDERMAAVRDLVSGLSFGNDFAKFGSNVVEQLGGKKGGQPRVNATAWLGLLDDNFPNIWKNAGDTKVDAISEQIKGHVNQASEELGDRGIPLDDLDQEGRKDFDKVSSDLGDKMGAPSDGDSKATSAKNIGRAYLRFMGGAGLDVTGGVMDLVTGIKKLKDADSALEKAGAGLQIGAGSATTGMAIANTVSMFAPKGANLAANIGGVGSRVMSGIMMGTRVAGPVLGIVGAVFGIAGSLIAEAINHKKMQKLTDSQGEFFGDLSSYGVTKENWGEKLEYARYASFMYGGRDTPDDQSLFEYQSKEWQHFQDSEGEHGSSLSRLAPYLHKDGDPGTENLWEVHMSGTTTRQTGKDHFSKTDDWRPWSDTDMEAGYEGLGTDEVRRNSRMDAMMTLYGKDFLDAHKAEIDTVATAWDDWNGDDAIVSRDDLRDIVADEGRGQSERDAAQFLLDENGFYDGLDSLKHGGNGDAKISTNDLDTWLEALGQDSVETYRQTAAVNDYGSDFLEDHAQDIQTIATNWDDWNGKDSIVSREDLQKIADDSGKSDDERSAARLLLDNAGFFDTLDTFQKGGSGDGKLSTHDLDDWLSRVGKGDLNAYRQETAVGGYDADFYRDNESVLTMIADKWDDWNGKDSIVSRKDLNKIAGDDGKSDAEREAAQFLLDDQDFFATLDTFQKNDGSDDKISTSDLDDWMEIIGVKRA